MIFLNQNRVLSNGLSDGRKDAPAVKTTIQCILEEKEFRARKINFIAVVVGNRQHGTLIVDDGTGMIGIRGSTLNLDYLIGKTILVIGREGLSAQGKYVDIEITRKVDNCWLKVRHSELKAMRTEIKKERGSEKEKSESQPEWGQVVDMIRTNDKGEGTPRGYIEENFSGQKAQEIIETLLRNGEVFEMTPGMLKVLE